LFSEEKDWLDHTRQEHRRQWRCAIKRHTTNGPVTFQTRAEFEEHMLNEHKDAFPKSQLARLTDSSARSVGRNFPFCPFCGPDAPHELESGEGHKRGPLDRHIINHLVYLALQSLPWIDDREVASSSDRTTRPETRETIRNYVPDLDTILVADFAPDEDSPPLDESAAYTPDVPADCRNRHSEWGMILRQEAELQVTFDPVLRSFTKLTDPIKGRSFLRQLHHI